jgi:polar amino acid transport system substrate-binding protein
LRILKYTLLIAGLAFGLIGCGGKEGPDASKSMQKNKMVRIATDAVNMPFEWGADTGVQGFDVDIGNEIAKDLGFEVKWIKSPFDRLFEILKNGEVELVISAISVSADRKTEFVFSESYFDSSATIAKRKDKVEIKGLSDLANRKVGVQAGTAGDKFMASQKTAAGVTVVRFPTFDDALGALNRTELDAVVGDEPILTYTIYKSYANLTTTGVRLTEEKFGVVTRKDEKELMAKVSKTIERLKKSGELDALKKKWFQNVMEETAKQREDAAKEEVLKEAPKDVTFNFIKTSGNFNMDRLDGYQVVLAGAQSYQSTPILTSGTKGSCKLGAVPPRQNSQERRPRHHL